MRYTLVMTRVKIEYMLFAAMLLVAGAAYGRGPVDRLPAVDGCEAEGQYQQQKGCCGAVESYLASYQTTGEQVEKR